MNTKTTNTTLNDEEKQQDVADMFIYETLEKESKLANNDCGVCKRQGFPIFLVRKAVVPKKYSGINWSATMRSLGQREPKVNLETHEYAYRTLRKGYVYILVKKENIFEALGYEVTPSGVFRHKTIHDMKERNIKEIPQSCTRDAHSIPGYFINIDTTVYNDVAYIAYTRRAWSHSTVQYYLDLAAKDPKNVKLTRFSKIVLSEEGMKEPEKLSPENRSFSFLDFCNNEESKPLEFVLESSQVFANTQELEESGDHYSMVLNKAIGDDLFISRHVFNSLNYKLDSSDKIKNNMVRMINEVKGLENKKVNRLKDKNNNVSAPVNIAVSALIVEDSFGIVEELSFQRQIKIEPIIQLIAAAERCYADNMKSSYSNILSGTKDLNDLFKSTVDKYKAANPDESGIIYEGKGKLTTTKPSDHWYSSTPQEVVTGDVFLDDTYYKKYENVINTGVSYEYFNEKRLHLRKTLSLITQHRDQIEEYYNSTAKDITYYDYAYTTMGGTCVFPSTKRYTQLGYVDIDLSPEQRKEHITQRNDEQGWYRSINYFDVKAFRVNDSARDYAEKKTKEEQAKYDNLLAKYREDQFREQDQECYNKLLNDLEKISLDYFHYVTWLFGSKERKSEYTPKKITEYNEVDFWMIECDTNGSNNHVGYLSDFIQLIDFTCLGGIELPYQYGIWDILLANEKTIYFHLTKGNTESSFWNIVMQQRLADIEKTATEYEKLSPDEALIKAKQLIEDGNNSAELDLKTEALLKKLEQEPEYKEKLDERFFWEKGKLILNLYSTLTSRVIAGLSSSSYKHKSIDNELIKQNLAQSSLVLNGHIFIYFTLKDLKAGDISSLMNYFSPLVANNEQPINDFLIKTEAATKKVDWDFIQISADVVSLYTKLAAIVELGNLSSFVDSIKAYYSNPWTEVEKVLLRTLIARKFKDIKVTLNSSKAMDLIKPFNINDLKLGNKYDSSGNIASGSAILISAVQLWAHTDSYYTNQQNLAEKFDAGVTLRLEIERKITASLCNMTASFVTILHEFLQGVGKNLNDAIRATIQTSAILNKMVNGVLVTVGTASAILGIVTSVITVIDGVSNFSRGLKKIRGGSTAAGVALVIGGSFQVIAGALSFIQGFGLLFFVGGPFGVILFFASLILGIAASIIMYIFEDESDNWDRMQIWFNRCLFGQWQTNDKGIPYPPTYDGMAYAMNDYFVARLGLNAVLDLYHERYLADSITLYHQPDKYRDYVTNKGSPKSSAAGQIKALYVAMRFPGYDRDVSDFEGSLRIFNKNPDLKDNNLVKLSILSGEAYPMIKPLTPPVDFFAQRVEILKPLKEDKNKNHYKVGKLESYNEEMDPKTDKPLGYFKIFYKIGEYLIFARHGEKINLQIKYWPQGRTSVNHKGETIPNMPILLNDTYSEGE